MNTHIHAHTCMHTRTHTPTHTHLHTHTYTHARTPFHLNSIITYRYFVLFFSIQFTHRDRRSARALLYFFSLIHGVPTEHLYTSTHTHKYTHTHTHTDGVPTEQLNPPQGILPTLKAELAKSLSPAGLIFFVYAQAELAHSQNSFSSPNLCRHNVFISLCVCVCVCVCVMYVCKYTCISLGQIAGWY
jgi:hypothetical protein